MWSAIKIINYVNNFVAPSVEINYPEMIFSELKVAPTRDEWNMVFHRITPGPGTHLHYLGGIELPRWGKIKLSRLLYLSMHPNAEIQYVGRDRSKCCDEFCVNPLHMKEFRPKTVQAQAPAPVETKKPVFTKKKVTPTSRTNKNPPSATKPKPKPKQDRSCEITRKVGYKTEQIAQEAINRHKKNLKGKPNIGKSKPYKCQSPFCGLWHITSHDKPRRS